MPLKHQSRLPNAREAALKSLRLLSVIKALFDHLHLCGVDNCCAYNVFNKRNDTFLTGIHRQVIVIKN